MYNGVSYVGGSSIELNEGKLNFTQFDVDKVLRASQKLLGSSGDEYKLPVDMEGKFLNL